VESSTNSWNEMAVVSRNLSFLLLFLSLNIAKCEFFTALIDLEHLIYRERELKTTLKNHIAMEEERLASLKKFSEKVEDIHSKFGEDDIEPFIGHPVNSYLIIKRFFNEWTKIEELIQKDTSEGILTY
jgi:prolyl 4-hydroxylase